QLTRITVQSGTSLNFRCPYQAKVMNTLEQSSSAIGISGAGMARDGMGYPDGLQRGGCDYHVPARPDKGRGAQSTHASGYEPLGGRLFRRLEIGGDDAVPAAVLGLVEHAVGEVEQLVRPDIARGPCGGEADAQRNELPAARMLVRDGQPA